MVKTLAVSLSLLLVVLVSPLLAQDDTAYQPFSPDQLDNLLAPIALYPDPLLAQVLVAATFPDQIDEASRFVRDDPNPDDVDGQPWDVSVKAVAHYPQVLEMMADKLDWTTAVGQAYVDQSTDVMASVQRLRAQAQAEGNLVTTPEMQVVDSGGEIELWPAQPQYLYVPEYDPAAVFFAHAPLFFGARLFIGAWLNVDFDWGAHRVFYHGWDRGGGWEERSRPYVHVTNTYVNNNYRNIMVNRNIIRQRVNYQALNRYDDVHRNTNFDRFQGNNRGSNNPPTPNPGTVRNKIIVRNFNTNDQRLNEYRGHVAQPAARVRVPDAPGFTPAQGGFDPRLASRRGQASRVQAQPPHPAPPPRPPARKVERKRP
jgi:hypothetical protein